MVPEHLQFGGGASASLLHPLVAVGALVAVVLLLTLPRDKAITPFLLAVMMTPWGQVLVLGGVHFTVIRILILAGLARGIWTKLRSSEKWFETGFSGIDLAAVLWLSFSCIVVTLQWMNSSMLVASSGNLVDSLGGYLVLRFLIPDGKTIRRAVKVLALVCVVHGIFMIGEQITRVNVFDYLGGVPSSSTIREGQLRSSGVFGPLGEGPFAGILVPLFIWLCGRRRSKLAGYAGLGGAAAMLITTHASTPWMAVAGSLLGLSFWPLRERMRIVRWGFVLILVALHLYMKSPVWHLIASVNVTGDSSSYHRYTLVNQTILHFSDWWFLGYRDYAGWDWDMWDTSNLFVATALTGGLISLVFLILAVKRAFGAIGMARKLVHNDHKREWFVWCLGSALFAMLVTSLGIAYLYQAQMEVYALLGWSAVVAFEAKRATAPSVEPLKKEKITPAFAPARSGLRLSAR
jgi:hypothetical protein